MSRANEIHWEEPRQKIPAFSWGGLYYGCGLHTARIARPPLYQIAATTFSFRGGRLKDKLIDVEHDVPLKEMIYVDFPDTAHFPGFAD